MWQNHREGGLLVSLWAAPSQAVLDLSRWWAPDTGPCPWVVHSDSGICLPRDWMQTQTPLPNQQAGWGTPSGITSAWTRLATCLSCLWREDSPLQGRHAVRSRTSGLAATSELGEMLALAPREPHPQGFSCSSQYSLLHLFRTQGPGSLQEEFWRWSHTCARIFALWVPLTPCGDAIQKAKQLSLRVRPALSLTYLVAAGKLSGLFPLS